MKLLDAEKSLDSIQKMSLDKKQKRILNIKESGFEYDDKKISEIIKDKWVFLQNGSDTDIVEIDYVILDWARKEELRIEIEQAESGNTWNTELFMYRIGVYKSYKSPYNDEASYVKFYADMNVEDCMDAKMKGSEPTLRHCHDWYTSPHKKSENHYKYENWLEDIQIAKNKFMSEVEKFTKGFESFQYNSKNNLYCAPEKFVFWIEEEADHNGDETGFFKSEIYATNKYKGSAFRSNTCKVPTKFDKTVSRGELLEIAAKHCEDKLAKHEFRKEFKY